MNGPATASDSARRDAKWLMRTARTGALATLDEGRPLATLVGVASDWDGSPLFLLSDLARHTQNLGVDAHASLLLSEGGGRGDPLNNPRITLSGVVHRRAGEDGRDRFVRRNPKAKLYIDFADFSLRRLQIEAVHFNGGFGRADRLAITDLLTVGEPGRLAQAQDELLNRVEALGDRTTAKIFGGASSRPFRPVGLDAEGLDLSRGGEAGRVDFGEAVFDPESWWSALLRHIDQSGV
jgi:putative heme iron utilization protein